MHAMYISINKGEQGATMSRKMKVSILCSHSHLMLLLSSQMHFYAIAVIEGIPQYVAKFI